MTTTIDFTPVRRSRVARSASAVAVSAADKAAGIRSVAEGAVFWAIKSDRLRTVAAVARAANLSEQATTKALRALEDRDLIRRATDGFGSESFAAHDR